jgi:hypothetical protein
MKAIPMPKLKDFNVILYESAVFHFPVKAADEEDAEQVAMDTYYGWSSKQRAKYVSTEQGGVDLDITEAAK